MGGGVGKKSKRKVLGGRLIREEKNNITSQ